MRCEQCRESMVTHLRQQLPTEVAAGFEEHLSQCVSCTTELEGIRKVLVLVEKADEPSIHRLVDSILEKAAKEKASDIHIEAGGPRTSEPDDAETVAETTLVRYRIDGVLHERMWMPRYMLEPVINRLRAMAGLSLTEKGPQEGRIVTEIEGQKLALLVSILRTATGERAVIRLLTRPGEVIKLDQVGLSPANREALEGLLHQPHGAIFFSGPAGSGRSTLAYAVLARLNHPEINIMTVEDPVEVVLEGIAQIPINLQAGVTFATALQAIARQDPDVLFCSEMRDLETIEFLLGMALSGHLVLSIMHPMSAVAALVRLLDVGVPRPFVAKTLLGLTGQRRLRTLCPECRRQRPPTEAELQWLRESGIENPPEQVGEAVGCENCKSTGYCGRIGIFEILVIDQELRQAVGSDMDLAELEKLAERKVLIPLRQDAAEKCVAGVTSCDEAQSSAWNM